jgi:hypothetical protein
MNDAIEKLRALGFDVRINTSADGLFIIVTGHGVESLPLTHAQVVMLADGVDAGLRIAAKKAREQSEATEADDSAGTWLDALADDLEAMAR